jgi:putative DNA-binding protein
MIMSSSFEQSFAQALLDPKTPIPEGIVAPNAPAAERRFAVHRNNVVAGLAKTLEARFPAVAKIVGQEFFVAMARAFALQRPPRSPLLASFGDAFADFIAAFEPAGELPYLPDVAGLEAARSRAYHAADATPVAADELAALDAHVAAGIRFDLHPSLEVVCSEYPVVTIWAMNCGERALEPVTTWRAEDALVVRPHLDVEVRLLPPGGAAFLRALAAGQTLGEAAEAALADCPEFDLTGNLAGLIGWGLVRRVIRPAERERS